MAGNQNITQITNIQSVFDPTTIIYGVPLATSLDTTFTGQVFRTWLFNNPTFTGTVTIPSGASIAGYAPLASPTFTGTIGGGSASINLGGSASFASIQSTPIGSTSASSGSFTTLTNSGAFTVNGSISGPGITTLLTPYATLASPTFTGTVVIPTVTLSGGTINGTSVGATTPSTGAFTTLSASSTVSGAGFSTYLASPPVIGGTTPAAVNANGGTLQGVTIGTVTPGAAQFSTLTMTGLLTPVSTTGIKGTITNDNANAGSIGEHITATGTAVGLTNNTPANITSISLTAGDWEVMGSCAFNPAAGTTISSLVLGISSTSATFPANGLSAQIQTTFTTATNQGLVAPSQRFSLASTTTVFLVAQAGFGVSTMASTGTIRARRVR